jgi:glycosyltransferase involved in cell wall biosynthesis
MPNDEQSQKPKVSVIIPAYNQAHFLDAAIQSVLSQTCCDYEIIVVNDGSTDDTGAVAQRYGERVRYIFQENQGLAGARNTGICAAQAELVALLDSDDLWLPGYLETMLSLAEEYPQAALFYCAGQCIDKAGLPLNQVVGIADHSPADLYQALLRANFLIPSTITMRRDAVVQAGLFDQTLRSWEDWELWLRLLPENKFIGINDVLVKYRIHGSSLSTDTTGMQRAVRAVVEKHFGDEDGSPEHWSADKRRAYGGLYRYAVLSSISRQNNWDCAPALHKALTADPKIKNDLSFFYDLVLGSQPVGKRGSTEDLDLQGNVLHVEALIDSMFRLDARSELSGIRRAVHATASKAIGVAAYNTGRMALSRKYLLRAIYYAPALLLDRLVMGNMVRSFLGSKLLAVMHSLRKASNQYAGER